MTTPNARKGSETERIVAKYLREQGFPLADRRLREGRADDQGDIDGVPHTVIQVKYVAQPRLQTWVTDTLKQRDAAGAPLCLLVMRTKYRSVEGWEAAMPLSQLIPIETDESEAWTWTRMDLRMAVVQLKELIVMTSSRSSSGSTSTGGTRGLDEVRAWHSAPSTEKGTPPSPTT